MVVHTFFGSSRSSVQPSLFSSFFPSFGQCTSTSAASAAAALMRHISEQMMMKKKKQKNRYRRKTTVSIKRKTVLYKKLMSTKKEEEKKKTKTAITLQLIQEQSVASSAGSNCRSSMGKLRERERAEYSYFPFTLSCLPNDSGMHSAEGKAKEKGRRTRSSSFLSILTTTTTTYFRPLHHTLLLRGCSIVRSIASSFSPSLSLSLSLSKLTCLHSHTTLH